LRPFAGTLALAPIVVAAAAPTPGPAAGVVFQVATCMPRPASAAGDRYAARASQRAMKDGIDVARDRWCAPRLVNGSVCEVGAGR